MTDTATRPAEPEPVTTRPRRSPLAQLARFQSVLGLVVVFAGAIAYSPTRDGEIIFLSGANLTNIVRTMQDPALFQIPQDYAVKTARLP